MIFRGHLDQIDPSDKSQNLPNFKVTKTQKFKHKLNVLFALFITDHIVFKLFLEN